MRAARSRVCGQGRGAWWSRLGAGGACPASTRPTQQVCQGRSSLDRSSGRLTASVKMPTLRLGRRQRCAHRPQACLPIDRRPPAGCCRPGSTCRPQAGSPLRQPPSVSSARSFSSFSGRVTVRAWKHAGWLATHLPAAPRSAAEGRAAVEVRPSSLPGHQGHPGACYQLVVTSVCNHQQQQPPPHFNASSRAPLHHALHPAEGPRTATTLLNSPSRSVS